MTGSGDSFYPSYEDSDPFAAMDRGYYFDGDDYMQLPPHTFDTSNSLVIGAENTISIWLKPTSTEGSLFVKQTNSQANIYRLHLNGLTPELTLRLFNLQVYWT